jgi:hypothetical protein
VEGNSSREESELEPLAIVSRVKAMEEPGAMRVKEEEAMDSCPSEGGAELKRADGGDTNEAGKRNAMPAKAADALFDTTGAVAGSIESEKSSLAFVSPSAAEEEGEEEEEEILSPLIEMISWTGSESSRSTCPS